VTTGTHETFKQRDDLKPSSDRSFGLVFTVLFALIAAWPWLWGTGNPRIWSTIVAVFLAVLSFTVPSALAPFNRLWTRFGLVLHKIVNPLIMGIIFFLTVTPIAVIFRLQGKDPLRLKLDANANTYWIERAPPGPPPDTMSQQF
jgi:hypothetical protein